MVVLPKDFLSYGLGECLSDLLDDCDSDLCLFLRCDILK